MAGKGLASPERRFHPSLAAGFAQRASAGHSERKEGVGDGREGTEVARGSHRRLGCTGLAPASTYVKQRAGESVDDTSVFLTTARSLGDISRRR